MTADVTAVMINARLPQTDSTTCLALMAGIYGALKVMVWSGFFFFETESM